jgi:hypothetical protein
VVRERGQQDDRREHIPDHQPGRGQVEIAGDRGDDPNTMPSRKIPPPTGAKRSSIANAEERANVTRARDDAGQHALADEDDTATNIEAM